MCVRVCIVRCFFVIVLIVIVLLVVICLLLWLRLLLFLGRYGGLVGSRCDWCSGSILNIRIRYCCTLADGFLRCSFITSGMGRLLTSGSRSLTLTASSNSSSSSFKLLDLQHESTILLFKRSNVPLLHKCVYVSVSATGKVFVIGQQLVPIAREHPSCYRHNREERDCCASYWPNSLRALGTFDATIAPRFEAHATCPRPSWHASWSPP